jgi:hypothetical protein
VRPQQLPRSRAPLLVVGASIVLVSLTLTFGRGAVEGAAPRHVAPATVTAGTAPITNLPDNAQPVAAAPVENELVVLGRPSGKNDLMIYRLDSLGAVRSQVPSGLTALGFRVGLAVAPDRTAWIGAGSRLVRVASDGTVTPFTLPRPQHPLSLAQRGVAPLGSGLSLVENGQITSLALADGSLFIGRAGHQEITRLEPSAGVFESIPLLGIGDVEAFSSGGGRLLFTVKHSGSNPSAVSDKFGIFDLTTRTISSVPLRARALGANGQRIAVSGVDGVRLLDDPAGAARTLAPQGRYDESRIALRADGVSVVRLAGGVNEVAFVDASGREVERRQYQVAIVASPAGGRVPYASTFVFASTTADRAVWFGLYGSPAIYRLPAS